MRMRDARLYLTSNPLIIHTVKHRVLPNVYSLMRLRVDLKYKYITVEYCSTTDINTLKYLFRRCRGDLERLVERTRFFLLLVILASPRV